MIQDVKNMSILDHVTFSIYHQESVPSKLSSTVRFITRVPDFVSAPRTSNFSSGDPRIA